MKVDCVLKSSLKNLCCHFVLFGATGDLALKKLLPSFYALESKGLLPPTFRLVAFARKPFTQDSYLKEVKKHLSIICEKSWKRLKKKILYHKADFIDPKGFKDLLSLLRQVKSSKRIFYLATHPTTYEKVIEKLSYHQLLQKSHPPFPSLPKQLIVIEKPYGFDRKSAENMQKSLLKYVHAEQVIRVDHYLGKSMFPWILNFRHQNPICQKLWKKPYIDHIQITLSEAIGIEKRGRFFEENGLIRDMVQNHLLQLICLLALPLPKQLDASSVRLAKLKVLKALRPLKASHFVCGQYSKGKNKQAYRHEKDVSKNSLVESFFAAKIFVDLPHFQEIPIYVRVGKRLKKRSSQLSVFFKPSSKGIQGLFQGASMSFELNSPGNVELYTPLPDSSLQLPFKLSAEGLSPSPWLGDYEQLLCDLFLGKKVSFVSFEEVQHSWSFVDPLLKKRNKKLLFYPSGSEGPQEAFELITKDQRSWRPL